VEIPGVLDYLERELPPDGGNLFGDLGVADIAIACFFRNAAFARFTVDATRWPITAAFVARVLAHPCFVALQPFENLLMRTPIARQREAKISLHFCLADHSLFGVAVSWLIASTAIL
jgi:hypothetical protein